MMANAKSLACALLCAFIVNIEAAPAMAQPTAASPSPNSGTAAIQNDCREDPVPQRPQMPLH
jgi:hypothetical protein